MPRIQHLVIRQAVRGYSSTPLARSQSVQSKLLIFNSTSTIARARATARSNLHLTTTTNLSEKKKRCFSSSGLSSGTDLLADSLGFSDKPKIIFDGYGPSGFDVVNVIPLPSSRRSNEKNNPNNKKNDDDVEEENLSSLSLPSSVHLTGSCLAFPHTCYLWKPEHVKDITVESLEPVLRIKPKIELLFIGCNEVIPPRVLNKIKKSFKKEHVIVEQQSVANAMASFNILNGEDRNVAVALIKHDDGEDEPSAEKWI